MKHVNVTFSLPESLSQQIDTSVEKQHVDRFVTKALEQALDKKQRTMISSFMKKNKNKTTAGWSLFSVEEWID